MANEITLSSLGKLAALAGGPLGLAQRYGSDIIGGLSEGARRAFEEAGKLQHYGPEYYDAGPVTQQALGAIGAPAVGPATTVATLGSGAIRRAAPTGRASVEEITRAARQSAGMTQPQLREVYRELGLTGQPPNPLVEASLRPQPQEAVDAAIAMKLADRAALDTLSPAQRNSFKRGENIKGFMLPSQEANEAGKLGFAPLKKEVTRAEKAFDLAASQGQAPSIFDLSPEALTRIPGVDQFPLPRMAPQMTPRLETARTGGLRRLESAAAGADPRDWGWYNIQEPLGTFDATLGPTIGPQGQRAWIDALAGTSMLNPIEGNVRASSAMLGRVMRGEPLPQVVQTKDPVSGKTVQALAGALPPGYGAKSQVQHAARVREYMSNLSDPVSNPKPFSYRQNLGGNYGPRTVDTHDIRNMIGMPQAKALFNEEMGSLLPGEYTTLENLGARASARAGKPQAMQQGATWIGGAEYTGLKSQPIPLADVLNRRVQVTAAVRGQTPEQAWINHITGKQELLSASAPLPGGAEER